MTTTAAAATTTPNAAAAATTGGGGADAVAGASLASGPTAEVLAVITSLVGVLVALLELQARQAPTASAPPAPAGPPTSGGGGSPTAAPVQQSAVQQSSVQQTAIQQSPSLPMPVAPPASTQQLTGTTPGGGPVAAAATPTTAGAGALGAPSAAAVLTGQAAVATILPKYLVGSPAPGGQLATIMSHASTGAMPARSENGAWTWVADGSGAQAFIHVHGDYWPQHLDQLGQAVQSGQLMPHVHPDGSLHLHDM